MSKYDRIIKGVKVDVYDIISAYQVNDPALQHLLKKALCAGDRGHKDRSQDLQDIVDSALRAQAMHQEKETSLYEHFPLVDLLHRLDQDYKICPPPGGWKIDKVMGGIFAPGGAVITNGKSTDPAATATVTIKNDGNVADQALADAVADEISKAKGDKKRTPGDKIRDITKMRIMACGPRDLRYEAIRALDRLANAVDGQLPECGIGVSPERPFIKVEDVIKESCKPGGVIYNAILELKN